MSMSSMGVSVSHADSGTLASVADNVDSGGGSDRGGCIGALWGALADCREEFEGPAGLTRVTAGDGG